ncbi:PTS transporter subunit EIIC, partial [Cronobacter malonaticus]|uniref:PTS transporter subunit EIIC n=1 Tax=Cronobacter malonaticus TaxID=413503 RepID=UPI001F4220BF
LRGVIVGGTLSLMIITGMHYVLVPIVINNISKLGYDPFKILFYVANMGQAGAAFGVFLRARNKKIKTLALSTSFSAAMGITEPAMYGINIRFKRPFIIWLVANMAGLRGVIVGGTLSLMIITGMHYVLVPIVINNISK